MVSFKDNRCSENFKQGDKLVTHFYADSKTGSTSTRVFVPERGGGEEEGHSREEGKIKSGVRRCVELMLT